MASSKDYRRMDTNDSEDSAESDHNMEQPRSAEGVPPDASRKQITDLFFAMFDRDISGLKALHKKLVALTDSVERIHRNTTIGSLSGGVIGAVGGITSIVGLLLTPFTLGASLIVTGVGIGVATAGGLTGAGSSITDLLKQRSLRNDIEETLKAIQDKLSLIIECVKQIEHRLSEIQSENPSEKQSENPNPLTNIVQAGVGIGRGAGYAAESLRLINFVEVGKVAAQASRTVKAAGAITGVFSGLFLLLDIVFIAKDAKELSEIDKQQKDGTEKSNTVQFIEKMRKVCVDLEQEVKEISEFRNSLQMNAQNLQEQNLQ